MTRGPLRRSDLRHLNLTRRRLLRAGIRLAGLPLLDLLRGAAAAPATRTAEPAFGRARSCIVFFCWGGVSQLETWDPKPEAPPEIRGNYRSIATATPGIRIGEYLPLLAKQTARLAIVRSVCHKEREHRNAAYWNLTGHEPHMPGSEVRLPPSRRDWPCLGSQVAFLRGLRRGLPGAVTLPYPIADGGLVNGQFSGFLGTGYDPLIVRPPSGKPYPGVSPRTDAVDLRLPPGVGATRMRGRLDLQSALRRDGDRLAAAPAGRSLDHYREMAADLLLNPSVATAFNLDREPPRLRAAYGDHILGQSTLLARRLTEAGVPLVTVHASAGDLNGGDGANWDTHRQNFPRLKEVLLPPLERASAVLLDDLAARGRLGNTLVVWLTEFGRTPRINAVGGRDHFPDCYSVVLAGGGVRGGQVLGRSDRWAAAPVDQPCGPADVHATIFHALGLPLDAQVRDALDRPLALTGGSPLPVFS